MDSIDKKILKFLEQNSDVSNKELAHIINLSPSATLERVKRLKHDGLIMGYHATIHPKALGRNIEVLILLNLNRHDYEVIDEFRKVIRELPEVKEILHISGNYDYALKVYLKDMDHYRDFLTQSLARVKGISQVHSSFVVERL